MTPSLLCRTCGEPAAHVHFIPWTEQPERVELACARHEPGGDDGEWFTLAELEAEPRDFLRTCERSATPAPKALTAWLGRLAAESKRAATSSEKSAASPPTTGPLTVVQAAERENVSTKTVYRLIQDGKLGDGAWKVGAAWRIDPAALDRIRVERQQPRRRAQRERVTAADIASKTPPTKARVWGRPS